MKKILFLSIIFIGVISCKQKNQSTEVKIIPNEKAIKLDSLFSELYKKGDFNGNVLVAEKGNVIFEKSFGLANEQAKEKLNKSTIFNLASVTKQFTAAAIVLLVNEGKLSYDDKIGKYIPELDFYDDVKIRNLLNHTSGLEDYMELLNKKWDKSKIATNKDVIELFENEKPKLLFTPNEKWQYSNTGYLLLASIIERVSKKKYSEFLKLNIFQPLKMENTNVLFVYKDSLNIPNIAIGYEIDSLGRHSDNIGYAQYFDGVYGQGRIYSNAEDLLKWDRSLYTNKIIPQKDKKLIFSSSKLTNEKDTDYGFGWFIDDNKFYGKIAYHSGSWAGYKTYFERELDNDKTIIILQNNDKVNFPIKNLRKILYDLPIYERIVLNDSTLKKYEGKYLSEKSIEKEVIFENSKLFIPMGSDFKFELIPVTKNKFIVDGFDPEVTYEFVLDKNGNISKYIVQQLEQGINNEAERIK